MGYLGAVIGAGFASGQEIVQFFVTYGNYGFKGTLIATVLFAFFGAILLYMAHKLLVSNYQDILGRIFGKVPGKIVDLLLAVFLFLGISTMLSASGAIFYEHLYLDKNLGIFLAFILILLFLLRGKAGLVFSYNILVPIKIILLLIISAYAAFFIDGQDSGEIYAAFLRPAQVEYWWISAVLYVAYNFALAMVVLTEYQSLTRARAAIEGAAMGGMLLGIMVVLNYAALSRFLPAVLHYEVPMLYVAGNISLGAKHLYTMVLWMGILTTALANTYGFAQRFARLVHMNYKLCLLFSLILALPLSMQSFSILVNKIYPVFGILGVLILGALLYGAIKEWGIEVYYKLMQTFANLRRIWH